MNTALSAPIATTAATATTTRHDMYASIHKALRHFMTDTLHRVGRMDVFDGADMGRALAQLEALLTLCVNHIHNENNFVHPTIEARQPRGASRTADDHLEHFESIDALRAQARAVPASAAAERQGLALRLYRQLALFVAENFQHMNFEETVNNTALWAHYSDAELLQLHRRILASLPADENMEVARWMIPALSPAERAEVLGGMQASAPPQAFQAVLELVRPHLDDSAWDKLARAIGVAQQPGLTNFR